MVKCALTPGTFDPITVGHLDVITRASQLVDEVIVAVAESVKKKPLFTLEERVTLAEEATRDLDNVRVVPFDGLLVDFAHEVGATAVVKGLRAITDFEFEFQMTAINYQLDRNLETLFIMSTPPAYVPLFVGGAEIASMGGDIKEFVPPCVERALRERSSGTNRVESCSGSYLFLRGAFDQGISGYEMKIGKAGSPFLVVKEGINGS